MDHSTYTLTALMENRPGVLNRVVSLFRRRGFNLDSLTVGETGEAQHPDVVIRGLSHHAGHQELVQVAAHPAHVLGGRIGGVGHDAAVVVHVQ